MTFNLDELITSLYELKWANSGQAGTQVDLKLVAPDISDEEGITVEALVLETNREDDNSKDKVTVEVFPSNSGMEPILTHVSQKRKVRVITKKT